MSQSLADVILHVVFSTKRRNPWIQSEEESYQYIHVLLQLGRTMTISKLISEIKSSSS